ncbi:hypothetical protein EIP91_007579 [Steccherinum ochraceum]|uniref:Protein kinase domain-containing protein n=1 Tax=Steccherinum ochraceum TaxID=92696 RepID=A0A4R0RQI2_9APHY|nr:hypothetical protein EIP91_007579 [Steccherinum ochraceum]
MTRAAFSLQFHDDQFVTDHRHHASFLKNYPTCGFWAAKGYPFHLESQPIQVKGILYCGDKSTVYLAECEGGMELALKFASEDDVLREAAAYDALEPIQGTVIPRLYGMLYARRPDKRRVFCLVMERFGNRVTSSFRDLPRPELAKVLNKLAEAHRGGLYHLDFAERNVVEKDGDYRLIDLRHAKPHSGCGWTYDFEKNIEDCTVDDADPSIQCHGLKAQADELEFWDYGYVHLCKFYSVPKSDKLPPQKVVDQLHTCLGISMTNYLSDHRRELAIKYFEEIKRRMDAGQTVEELVRLCDVITYDVHLQWHKEKNIPFHPSAVWDLSERRGSSHTSF